MDVHRAAPVELDRPGLATLVEQLKLAGYQSSDRRSVRTR